MTRTLLTHKEVAKEIRKELKEQLGYNSRQVSVRCSGGCTVHVIVIDKTIETEAVRKLAESYKDIDYDIATGEVLLGGNIYIHVSKN